MAKTDITIEQALVTIDKVVNELGLLFSTQGKGFYQVVGPTTKHKVYVQRSTRLNRIDTSMDLAADLVDAAGVPLRIELKNPNGSIKCHVAPSLENLERVLRMLADAGVGTHVMNRPRPFAPTKDPVRKPRPITEPVPEIALVPVPENGSLEERLATLRHRGRLARVNRLLENDTTGTLTREEAEAIEDGRISPDDLGHRRDVSQRDAEEAIASGIEVES